MIKLFLLQIVTWFIISLILDGLRSLINRFRQNDFRLRLIDAVPILALFFIHQLTFNFQGRSWDPALIIIWMFMGILVLIYKTFINHRVNHKKFYLTLWRIGDLLLLFAWLFAGIINIF